MPWFRPQHLNFVPLGNLEAALRERGLDPVAAERGRAHQPVDFLLAAFMLLNTVIPNPDDPWRPAPPTSRRRFARELATMVALPLVVTAALADMILGAVLKRSRGGNCYRVLARRVAAD